jgi:O-antigen/teichoic acid export membrane protein
MASASKNIFWLSISRVSAAVLVLFAYTQLLRYLGPDSFGKYQVVLSYITIFGVVVDFGLQQYIIKKISENKDSAKKFFHNFLAAEVILALFIYAVLVGIAWLKYPDPEKFYGIVVAGVGMAIAGITYPFLSVLSAYYDLKKVALINFVASVVNVSVIFSAILFHKHIVWLAMNQVIASALALILYYHFVKKYIPEPQVMKAVRSLDVALMKKMFLAAFPFALLVGFSTIYNRIDILLIDTFLGDRYAGLYGAAYRFFDFIGFFPAVISHSLYPVFASLMAEGKLSLVRQTIEKYLRFLLALAIPMGVGGTLLAKPIIILFAGQRYAEAAPVLAILVWAPAILFIYIIANSLVISQLTKFAVVITGVNVLINVVGNSLLLPYYGIKGAAIMTLVSEFLQGIFYFYFIRKKITSFRFFGFVWRPLIASAIMAAAILWIGRDALIWPLLSGTLIYGLVLWLLGFFSKDDTTFVKNFLRPASKVAVVP